jgi:WXXGXW repeat (2 copies)
MSARLSKGVCLFLSVAALCGALTLPNVGVAQISVSVDIAPPPLPVYEQPEIPGPGYLWTPGYWSYGPDGYFWVPGTWVQPPVVGLLWTPGYWGWSGGLFLWNAGYWGPQVGFYGGVNYGYGYVGHGYEGGYWRDNQFYYNRSVTNITNVHITNVYNKTVVNNVTVQRVSYVGGPGGIVAKPTAQEEQVAHLQHTAPTAAQTQHVQSAASRHDLLASVNHGKPAVAATAKPGDFQAHVVAASRAGGPMPAQTAANVPAAAAHAAPIVNSQPIHARDLPKSSVPPPPSDMAAEEQQNYARQAANLQAKHDQERESLARQQDQDHANLKAQSNSNSEAMAAMERQHQQQTQELQQRHTAEQQQMQHQQPHSAPAAPHPAPH